ncbi:hypothetical protein GGR53DRAFT_468399 [Hypoxylon sp. FL1150]|nr:hypothetical protein GGR53DRAFT_468399 [Hypoxylon sp. FL1150]
MGGIRLKLTDLTSFHSDRTELGLPKAREVLACVGFSGIPPCDATGQLTVPWHLQVAILRILLLEFWNFGERNLVFAPYTSPLYSNTAFFLLDLVVKTVSGMVTSLLPTIDAGKDVAQATFAGTYVDEETSLTLTLKVDHDGPGFNITEWVVRGKDAPSHWFIYLSAISSSLLEVHVSMRLYPSGPTAARRHPRNTRRDR